MFEKRLLIPFIGIYDPHAWEPDNFLVGYTPHFFKSVLDIKRSVGNIYKIHGVYRLNWSSRTMCGSQNQYELPYVLYPESCDSVFSERSNQFDKRTWHNSYFFPLASSVPHKLSLKANMNCIWDTTQLNL